MSQSPDERPEFTVPDEPVAGDQRPAGYPEGWVGPPAPDTMPAPEARGDAPAEPRTERPHPLTPFARGWILLVGALVFFGREYLPDGTGRPNELPPLKFILAGLGIAIVVFAAMGFMTWWFTRFVVEADEFRYETGALFRSSKVVPFERIQTVDITQPLLARILGLAELRIDAGSDSLELRYLGRSSAYRFRDYLMTRATGRQVSSQDPSLGSGSGMLADVHSTDEVLVRLQPKWVVIAFLTSSEFLSAVVLVIVGLVLALVFEFWWLLVPLLLPAGIGLVSLVPRRVLNQLNYTLSRLQHADRADSVKVSRGLTALASQSVPLDRIQGIQLRQSVLWRTWGLWQINIDVLGQQAVGEGEGSDIGAMLLPPAPPEDVRTAVKAIWPEVDIDSVPMNPVPARAKWLRPFTSRYLQWGFDERVAVSRFGRWWRYIDVVPHSKAQSVSIDEGPLQRKLGLATVSVHTTPGPVQLQARHLSREQARGFLLGELDRARAARRPLR
ncbi:PH domain-containing protein [Enemella sp. A6]|uniref:PH domain-containing protein n=1 Tax=Enemella sp. A6 TaxID=3440152 RepID=UPI003EB9B42A